jgi:hypothetical protein
LPLDGSIFDTATGYERTATASPIPVSFPSTAPDMLMFVGEYVIETFNNAINTKEFSYATSILGVIPVSVYVTNGTKLMFENGAFSLTVQPSIRLGLVANFTSAITVKVSPTIKSGSSSYIATVNPGLSDVILSDAHLRIFGINLPLTWIVSLFSGVIKTFANKIAPSIKIPAISALGFYVTSGSLQFTSGYSEASMSVKFT